MIVEVKASARLHLGLTELGGHFGRVYGGLGVAISQPTTHVVAETSDTLEVEGLEKPYVGRVVSKLEEKLNRRLFGKVKVVESIPAHVGLGSRTQLSLSVATAVCRINGLDLSVKQLAEALGRGGISGVGTAVFERGGFVVDMPKKIGGGTASSALRIDFPEDWAFTVAYNTREQGPSDEQETYLFSRLPRMDENRCAAIAHILIAKLLPALTEKDAHEFGESLTEIQKHVGGHFSSVQGGLFRDPEALEALAERGALGVGQSSWGPAVYGFFASYRDALDAAKLVGEKLGGGWTVFATKAKNTGAEILVAP
ncbi:MAG: hypothetical protein NZ570_03830 [Candidatus Caldarchaeum sp.]|nr:hypothetical protein [Candidatus Caldarchaeum sp.]MCS7136902.1 hypothetical protein [Candidatus Caldarchaeum sp.]MDW7978360.1 hypothetical protein [Candidatus Caldarchaeum sp.]MDW8359827.1 hypothetical protein [Candidatus Caldarchaeum sp.]